MPRVVRSIDAVPADAKPSVVTIGVFDGVHRGHQALVRMVVERARAGGVTPAAVTFDPHPLAVVAPGREPRLLSTVEERVSALGRLGIETVLILRFDEELRRLSPEGFVKRVLVDGLGAVHVVTGTNFRFGYRHAGTIETLSDLGTALGFGVTLVALIAEREMISSSLIRRHVAAGRVGDAAAELGRPFRLDGVVGRGAGRGRALGVPTANLVLDPRLLLPKIGVYAGRLLQGGQSRPAVINVGLNPTFEDREGPVVEVHALDFDRDLYGEKVGVEFAHRLRDELRYPDPGSLVEQIRKDIERARSLLRG
ncbi:MAG: bifunctional riboflavin kinase/FAD synthetase [Acidobacteria bacterium]|nr:bifunctional riboflavin kinase/FAD synthetase [Acidobacteriota bacterium]